MASLQKVLEEAIAHAPRQALEHMLRPKLKGAGVKSWRKGAAALASHLLKNDGSEFQWEDPVEDARNKTINLQFSEDDGIKLERISDVLSPNSLSEIILKLVDETAASIRKRYEGDWHRYRRQHERSFTTFKNNIEIRWGAALDGLRILLDLCLDEGAKYQRRLEKSTSRKSVHKRAAILKLHVRACQVTSEIICLLENGYPNGAVARWRTLYELEVVATFLSEGGDPLAKRYLDHEAVDEKRAADLYQRTYVDEGSSPMSKSDLRAVEAEYRKTLKEYGQDFSKPYGWASEHLGNPSPRFVHLENAVSGARLRNRYKVGSYNIHASSSSFAHNLWDLTGEGMLSAGASNARLAAPGHLTALTLLRVTYLLWNNLGKLDTSILANALIGLRDDTISDFWRADALLREDDAAIRAAGAEHGFEVDTSFI